MGLLLYIIRKYSILTIVSIYFLISNEYVVNPTYSTILLILSLVSLFNSIDIKGIYTTPDIMGMIIIEIMLFKHIL